MIARHVALFVLVGAFLFGDFSPRIAIFDGQLLGIGSAEAQQRRGFFSNLFGGRKSRDNLTREGRKRLNDLRRNSTRKRVSRKRSSTAAAVTAGAATVFVPKEEVTKDIDAQVVLVIGGTYGKVLQMGLRSAFASDANVRIEDKTKAGSGLLRTDKYDWPAVMDDYLRRNRVDIVVVMFGIDDRRSLKIDNALYRVGTEQWNESYQKNLSAIQQVLADYRKPVFWVGVPPVSGSGARAELQIINSLYENASATRERINFIDVWETFLNEDGGWSSFGPDINGNSVRLRLADGASFTRAGREKLAFYAEQEIRRIVSKNIPVAALPNGLSQAEIAAIQGRGDQLVEIKIQSLTTADPRLGETLDGEASAAFEPVTVAAGTNDPAYLIGTVILSGRVDDFRWPPADDIPPPASDAIVSYPPVHLYGPH